MGPRVSSLGSTLSLLFPIFISSFLFLHYSHVTTLVLFDTILSFYCIFLLSIVLLKPVTCLFYGCAGLPSSLPHLFYFSALLSLKPVTCFFYGCAGLPTPPHLFYFSTLVSLKPVTCLFYGCDGRPVTLPHLFYFSTLVSLKSVTCLFYGCAGLPPSLPHLFYFSTHVSLKFFQQLISAITCNISMCPTGLNLSYIHCMADNPGELRSESTPGVDG